MDDNVLQQLESKYRRLAELRQKRDISKQAAKSDEEAYRAYEAQLLEEVEESPLKGAIQFDFGGDLGTIRFHTGSTIFGRIVDKNAALDAFENEALMDEMTESKVAAKRLNEYVRDRLEAGQELPDGIGYYEKKYFTISRKN